MSWRQRRKAFRKLTKQRDGVFARFPLFFTLMGTFGVSLTYYGLGHLFDKLHWLAHSPFIALVAGLGVLFITGSLYKRLG